MSASGLRVGAQGLCTPCSQERPQMSRQGKWWTSRWVQYGHSHHLGSTRLRGRQNSNQCPRKVTLAPGSQEDKHLKKLCTDILEHFFLFPSSFWPSYKPRDGCHPHPGRVSASGCACLPLIQRHTQSLLMLHMSQWVKMSEMCTGENVGIISSCCAICSLSWGL